MTDTGTDPYSATTTPVVTRSGTSAAATARMAVDEIHFDSQIEPRETGLDATQARVPVSRSWTMRLATAKTAATTKICEASDVSRLVAGSSDGIGTPASSGSGKAVRT